MRVDTELGEDVLLLEAFAGEEGISTPFRYVLDLLSQDGAVSADDILRTPVVLRVMLSDGSERVLHGLVSRFAQLGRVEELTAYRAEVVPWVWFLSLSSDCRIFQNLSVLEIVKQIFDDLGYSDYEIKCVKSYPKREYCVQYRESHLDFVSRLLEEEGIFYFFQHSDDKHVLVLADDNSAFKPCAQPAARMASTSDAWQEEDVIVSLELEEAICTEAIRLRDYNYLRPTLDLETSISGEEGEEQYDYPGRYAEPSEGDRLARLRLEERKAGQTRTTGQGNCRSFESGYRFDLQEHYSREVNTTYVLTSVSHSARAGDYHSWDSAPFDYKNSFVATPHAVPYRPPLRTPRPLVRGSQTAVVVGPSGEEIWVDKHGRIKIQFHWDRLGQKDENSSCWVRVSTTWAGKGWGFLQIPRIGQEVVVDFLEGDPDLPLVTGSVYNGEQTPPMGLPQGGIKSGMISRSSKGGGGYNEISVNDTKGKEGMTIHAQYNRDTVVENDDTITVNNNRTTTIAVDDTLSVGSNQKIDVGADRSTTIGANENLSVGSNRTVDVGVDDSLSAGANINVSAGATVSIDGGAEVKVSAPKISLTGQAEVSITVGGSSIKVTPAGVDIMGPMINGTAQGVLSLMGATIKLN
jgi:type VI secretion system secreted protein VgrG